jgi:hypothetical protein
MLLLYIITESATPPAVGAAGWTANAWTTITATSEGAKTYYPYAKDAAGNVGAGTHQHMTITLPDTTDPIITDFALSSPQTSLTFAIDLLLGTDAGGITGWKIQEDNATEPSAALITTMPKPTTITATTEGVHQYDVWAKDAAGNIGHGAPQTITITLPEEPLEVGERPQATGRPQVAIGARAQVAPGARQARA